ncbi:hypothetical protein DXG01_000656 [Tephrocybe rancida]|nr:hypothetical protein DXG01_000656 [Tephrocybe rancida]
MLPPPPPPQAPDSRSTSPAPRPRPRSRSRSRSRSSMAFRRGDREGEGEGEEDMSMGMDVDADMPTIAINALRGVRAANAELSEERRRSQSLLGQLNALTTAHESLKAQQSSDSENLRSSLQQIAALKEEASVLSAERDGAVRMRQEDGGKMEALKRGMRELGESHAALRAAFRQLKEASEQEMRCGEEVRGAKAWAGEALKKLEPLLEDGTCFAKEARSVVGELQGELADSRRVVDLLRDKLHHLSSTLADSQGRMRELEAVERESREHFKGVVQKLQEGAEERVGAAKTKLEEMEGEMKELRECRHVKIAQDLRMGDLTKMLRELEEAHTDTTAALDNLRAEHTRLGVINDGLVQRLSEVEEKRRIGLEAVAAREEELIAAAKAVDVAEERTLKVLQERFDAQTMTLRLTKEQYGDLQERLQASEDASAATREALERARVSLATNCTDIKRMADEALEKADEQCAVLGAEAKKLRADAITGAGELKDTTAKLVRLQERGESQEKSLEQAESWHAALECNMRNVIQEKVDEIDKLKKDSLLSQEGALASLIVDPTQALQEQVNAQAASLQQALGRYSDLRVRASTTCFRLGEFAEQTQKSSASIAEELSASQAALEEARQEIIQRLQDSMRLVKLCEGIEDERAKAEEERLRRVHEEVGRSREEDQRVKALQTEVDQLEREKKDLEAKLGTLRWSSSLTKGKDDDEKDFVDWVMRLATSLHEEEDVVKANELRRKENFAIQLQTKIRELESSLAHLIKEKEEQLGGTSKSMIDLDAFMTSSPSPCPTEITPVRASFLFVFGSTLKASPPQPVPAAPLGDCTPVSQLSAKAIVSLALKPSTVASDPDSVPAPVTKQAQAKQAPPPKSKPLIGLSFSSLEDSDSEEEIPLSEASAAKTVLGKRERVSSPAKAPIQRPIPSSNLSTSPIAYKGTRRLTAGRTGSRATVHSSPPPKVPPTVQKKVADGGAKSKKKRK